MKLYTNLIQIKEFLHKMDVQPSYFILSIFLSFGAAFFEGVSVSLLIPMVKGVLDMDFNFVRELPVFKQIIAYFPHIFLDTIRPNSSIFILIILAIFVTVIVKNILRYSSYVVICNQTAKFSNNLRQLIFNRYLTFGKLFFDRTNIGYLNNILLNYTEKITDLFVVLRGLIGDFFVIIVYVSIMFIISWKLTLLAILIFPVLNTSIKWLIERIKKTSQVYTDLYNKQAKQIFNIISCIPLVKSYTQEEKEKKRFRDISTSVADLQFSMDKKHYLISPIQEVIMLTMLLLLVSVIAYIFIKGQSGQIAGFLIFFYIIRKCIPIFDSLGRFRASLAKTTGPINETSNIMADRDKFFIAQGEKEFNGLKKDIEFRNLNFSYIEGVKILKNINFSIQKNKVTAIVGPTGSGKTTLINLILRFYDCLPSSILIDGVDIRDFTLKSLRLHMALISQDTLLFNDTIKDNITYGLDKEIPHRELIDIVKKARLYDFITGLPDTFDTLIGDRGVKLSGGEKQRISIARALLKGSEIFIMDEATSSLDTRTEKLIQEAIDEVIKDKTVIVIAHRLSTIKHADNIVVIDGGTLIEQGSLNELLSKKGKFHEYWQEQKFY